MNDGESEQQPRSEWVPPSRDDIMWTLTEIRSGCLRILANNHHPRRIVTLPRSAIEAVKRAQDAIAEAGQQTLDNWDTIVTDPKSD